MKYENARQKFRLILAVAVFVSGCRQPTPRAADAFMDFVVDPQKSRIEFFWRDNHGDVLRSIGNLKNYLAKTGKTLRFAMNGGMYQENNRPLGLFIENRKTIEPLNTRNGIGNFYLQPNGVFYLTTDRRAFIKQTQDFSKDNTDAAQIEFATQSGPLLIVNGAINPLFKSDSVNLNVRNGVCVLDDGTVIFSISRDEINFYDFAAHFLQAGCRNALYLDGLVSRMYLPEKNIEQTDGNFGVIIGITD